MTDPTVDINAYPLTPAARAQLAEFDRSTDNPTANCVPKGMPTIMEAPYPIEFVRQDGGDILLEARGIRSDAVHIYETRRARAS